MEKLCIWAVEERGEVEFDLGLEKVNAVVVAKYGLSVSDPSGKRVVLGESFRERVFEERESCGGAGGGVRDMAVEEKDRDEHGRRDLVEP